MENIMNVSPLSILGHCFDFVSFRKPLHPQILHFKITVHNFGPDFLCGIRTLSCKNEKKSCPTWKTPVGHANSTNFFIGYSLRCLIDHFFNWTIILQLISVILWFRLSSLFFFIIICASIKFAFSWLRSGSPYWFLLRRASVVAGHTGVNIQRVPHL